MTVDFEIPSGVSWNFAGKTDRADRLVAPVEILIRFDIFGRKALKPSFITCLPRSQVAGVLHSQSRL